MPCMASCIRPSCNCSGFQSSTESKWTLFGRVCQRCNHSSDEHRELTEVDKLLLEEIAHATTTQHCSYKIPAVEVARSPVFGPHDPIPLVVGDTDIASPEYSVSCICKGFQVKDMARIWQQHRTLSISETRTALPKISCSFCQHSLLNHLDTEPANNLPSQTGPEVSGQSLKYTHSLLLDFTPLHHNCVKTLVKPSPTESDGSSKSLVLVCLSASTVQLGAVEGLIGTAALECADLPLSLSMGRRIEIKAGNKVDSVTVANECDAMEVDCTSAASSKKKKKKKKVSQQQAQQSQQAPETGTTGRRKSSRIAAIQLRTKTIQSSTAALIRGGSAAAAAAHPVTAVAPERVEKQKKELVAALKSLKKKTSESFVRFKIPEITETKICLMDAVIHATVKEWVCIAFVAANGDAYISALKASGVVDTCSLQPPSHSSPACLSWQKHVIEDGASCCGLCMGCRSGHLYVWKVTGFGEEPSKCQSCLLSGRKDGTAGLVSCQWSADGRSLVAGSMMGCVLFYSVGDIGSLESESDCCSVDHVQTVHCSRSAVTCMAWSRDGCTLAVGGTDDCVQVLHIIPQKEESNNSILKYFSTKKFNVFHTHSLQGHLSFVTSLSYLDDGLLVSVGMDGCLLVWKNLQSPSLPFTNRRASEELPFLETEPHAGFRLGPAASCDSLPFGLTCVGSSEVLVSKVNTYGSVTLVQYSYS